MHRYIFNNLITYNYLTTKGLNYLVLVLVLVVVLGQCHYTTT